MKPILKAEELIEKYLVVHTTLHCKKGCITIDSIGNESAIRCALIYVDDIIKILLGSKDDYSKISQLINGFKDGKSFDENLIYTRKQLNEYAIQNIMYWGMVKTEIERYEIL